LGMNSTAAAGGHRRVPVEALLLQARPGRVEFQRSCGNNWAHLARLDEKLSMRNMARQPCHVVLYACGGLRLVTERQVA
jgi:hypothetical protein